MEKGEVKIIWNILFVNIRIFWEVIGCLNKIMKYIIFYNRVYNIIIILLFRCGKIIILRDIVRNIFNGINFIGFKGRKVVVVDERSEIGVCYFGIL